MECTAIVPAVVVISAHETKTRFAESAVFSNHPNWMTSLALELMTGLERHRIRGFMLSAPTEIGAVFHEEWQ